MAQPKADDAPMVRTATTSAMTKRELRLPFRIVLSPLLMTDEENHSTIMGMEARQNIRKELMCYGLVIRALRTAVSDV
jgi:hypothetical protein